MNAKSALKAIEKAGALLVFPIDNKQAPASLWSHFFPREDMRWEWDDNGDDRVARLWHLRGDLSTTRKAVYTKWYRGRATYFSLELFPRMLRALNSRGDSREGLSPVARQLLSILEGESPLSTKELKRMAGLKGRANETQYTKAMQELWTRLLIVAFGEVEDGAFPSLAVGATRVLFEDLWRQAFSLDPERADAEILAMLGEDNLFYRHYAKSRTAKKKTVTPKKKPAARSVVRFEDL